MAPLLLDAMASNQVVDCPNSEIACVGSYSAATGWWFWCI